MRNNQWATVNEVALGRHAHWKCLVRVAYPDGDDPLARIGEVS
jgi:hypothetical protein